MKKKILVLAISSAICAPTVVFADVTVYGKLRQSVDLYDETWTGDSTYDNDNFQINDRVSRIGLKGSEDLGDGLKAIYKMEFGVNISGTHNSGFRQDGNNPNEFSPDDIFSGRNAYVGLSGGMGTLLVGRHDHPLKMSTGKFDIFADTAADANYYWTGNIGGSGILPGDERPLSFDLRADGVVAYVSPSMNGLTFVGALVPGENNDANGIADAYSFAFMYNANSISAAFAFEDGDSTLDALDVDEGELDYKQIRAALEYNGGDWKVGGVYANVKLDNIDGDGENDTDSWNIYGTYAIGNTVLKARYFESDSELDYGSGTYNDESLKGWTIGAEHNLSKRTQVYALYTDADVDYDGENGSYEYDGDFSVLSFGINHNF